MEENTQAIFPVMKDGKYGFIDRSGQVITDFEFDGASDFSEGLARIFVGNKVGFVNIKGEVVILPKFDMAMNFSDGLAACRVGGKAGYINKEGKFAINPAFNRVTDFAYGAALVFEDVSSKGSFIDKQGNVLVTGKNFMVSRYSEGLINCGENSEWGYINLTGHFVIPATYQYTREFSEGKAAVSPKKSSSGKPNRKGLYGFINKNNEMVIPPVFNGADIHFSEGLCAVWDKGYGYIDDKGTLVIPCDFNLGQHFSEGLAVFEPKGKGKTSKYGYINKAGDITIEPIFTSAESFKNGLASVIVSNKYQEYKYGYIDKEGNFVWEPTR
ncbi:WG repeat-containing protein [Hymenobacter saemangeumensis]|uniref:WG repeat-containing protein n=1 Tax=Hymenobacter saemangeumensis TaxID=1084522 RepID=A0ABP8IAE4_9BACT